MKTLLYMITLSELGGAQSHLLQLIEGFRLCYDIHLATSTKGPLTESAEKLGITVHLLNGLGRDINPLSDIHSVRECIRLIRSVQPDLIHVHSSKAGLIGRIAAYLMNTPSVFTAHGWGFKPGVPAYRRWVVWVSEFFTARLTDKIICVSKYDEKIAKEYHVGSSKKIVMIHNGLKDCTLIASPQNTPIQVVMTARFQEPKDQLSLLRSFSKLSNNSNIKLVFIGTGPLLRESQQLVKKLGLNNQVSFLGERDDIAELLQRAQIFVLLSHYEGLPISILEAMRAGLPIIASDVGGIAEEVDSNLNGILVASNDTNGVTMALQRLVTNPFLRQKMGSAGRRKFLQEFTADIMLEKTRKVYEDVLQSSL